MQRHTLYLIVLIMLVMVLLQGCQAQSTISTPIPNVTISATTQPIASPTHAPIKTSKPLPSSTSTITLTPTTSPTRTKVPTNTPTWTPLPTLPPADAQALILELMETNGGCKLPCWWGMTPGKTEWLPSKAFLDSFAIDIYPKVNPKNTGNYYTFEVPTLFDSDGKYNLSIHAIDGIIDTINTSGGITLSEMLSGYGIPKDILIFAKSSSSMLPYASYELVLYYPDQGIFAIYEGETQHGRRLQICPSEFITSYPPPYLYLWSPGKNKTFDDIREELQMPRGKYDIYYPIEDLSGMSMEEFYTTYVDPTNANVCFEIPDPADLPTPTATSTSP